LATAFEAVAGDTKSNRASLLYGRFEEENRLYQGDGKADEAEADDRGDGDEHLEDAQRRDGHSDTKSSHRKDEGEDEDEGEA